MDSIVVVVLEKMDIFVNHNFVEHMKHLVSLHMLIRAEDTAI